MCPDVEAHCHGLNLPGHTFVLFLEEKLQVRGSHKWSRRGGRGGGAWPQVVFPEVGAEGPLHLSVMSPWNDPLHIQGSMGG